MTIERPMFPPRAESVDSLSSQTATGQPDSGSLLSESPKPAQGLSRRNMLAGLAVMPIALPAAASGSDPIFAAIDACRTAKQASDHGYARKGWLHALAEKKFGEGHREARNAFVDEALGGDQDDYTDAFAVALSDAYEAFAQTVPTTLAGLFAMLIFVDEAIDEDRFVCDVLDVTVFSSFATAAKSLIGRQA